MATILLDKTLCIVCGEAINEHRPFVAFSAFVVDENDPIFIFSDSACHDDCLAKHDLVDIATERFREWESNTGPGNRSCVVCKEEILDPDDYIMIDHLSSDDICISQYNYTHLHRSHITSWSDLDDALKKIKAYRESSNWGGEYLVTSLEEGK
jgi:hypothetical protein